MINQLFGITYFSDLTMLGHLVAVSFGVSAKTILGWSFKELRAHLTKLELLCDVFFAEKFNYFKFEKVEQEGKEAMTLNSALNVLQDFLQNCQDIEKGNPENPERKSGYNLINDIVKWKFSSCIVMQIRYCTTVPPSRPDQPLIVDEHIAT